MAKFIVGMFERHLRKYEVEAASAGEAVDLILNDQTQAVDLGGEFFEIDCDAGMSMEENQDVTDYLMEQGHLSGSDLDDGYIPSISGVEEVKEETSA